MRVSSLFRRTQSEGVFISENVEERLIERAERRYIERRQSNSSSPESPAQVAASSPEPVPVQDATTKAFPTPDVGKAFTWGEMY